MMIATRIWGIEFMKCRPGHSKITGHENRFVDNVTFSIGHCMVECENRRREENCPRCSDHKVNWNSEESGSSKSMKSEASGQVEGPGQSEESKEPLCAHLLQLVAQIRSTCPSHRMGQKFVIRGQRHMEVPGSPKENEADLTDF